MKDLRRGTSKGKWDKVICDNCRGKYAFPLFKGDSTALLHEAMASHRHSDTIEEPQFSELVNSLRSHLTPDDVPCLHCGAFQSYMIQQMRSRATEGHFIHVYNSVVVALVALCVVLPLCIVGLLDDELDTWVKVLCGVGCLLAALFGYGSYPTYLEYQEAKKAYKPDQGIEPVIWIEYARKRGAVTSEEFKELEGPMTSLNDKSDQRFTEETP